MGQARQCVSQPFPAGGAAPLPWRAAHDERTRRARGAGTARTGRGGHRPPSRRDRPHRRRDPRAARRSGRGHAQAIGHLKAGTGAPPWRPEREAQVIARLTAANPGPLTSEHVARALPPGDVRVHVARAEAARGLPRPRRHVQPRRRDAPLRRLRRRGAPRDDRRGRPRRRGGAGRLCRGARGELHRRRGGTHARPHVHHRARRLRRGEAAHPPEPDVAGRRAGRGAQGLLALAVAGAVRAVARAAPAAGAAGGGGEQRGGRAARLDGGRGGGDRRRPRGEPLRPADPRAAHRGRAQQHHALLDPRPAGGSAVGARRDLAGDERPQPPGRRAPPAGAARAPRRVDDPLRVAPRAHRPVGIPVLRRPRRPPPRARRWPRRSPSSPSAPPSSSCWAPTRQPDAPTHARLRHRLARPRLRPPHRALRPGQAGRRARPRDGPRPGAHRQAREQREPARTRAEGAQGHRRRRGGAVALPGRQRLRAQGGARRAA